MSKRREPIDLIIAKGKKHLTKNEIEERKNQELNVDVDKNKIKPPDYLMENLKQEFIDISKKLLSIGIMTELDVDCLAQYLLAKQFYLKYTSLLTKELKKGNIDKIEKYMAVQDKAYKQCRASANDLGLTISSRCKLIMPKTNEIPKQNKFKKFEDF